MRSEEIGREGLLSARWYEDSQGVGFRVYVVDLSKEGVRQKRVAQRVRVSIRTITSFSITRSIVEKYLLYAITSPIWSTLCLTRYVSLSSAASLQTKFWIR